MARAKMPNIHPCVVDSLIDPQKYPNAFRLAPSNTPVGRRGARLLPEHPQGEEGRGHRRHHRLRHGGGRTRRSPASRRTAPRSSTRRNIDATQPDMMPDMLRARERRRRGDRRLERLHRHGCAHAEHPRHHGLGRAVRRPPLACPRATSRNLLDKPANWEKVYVHRLPQLQLRRRRQAAAAHAGARRQDQGQDRPRPTRCCGGSPAASTR